MVRTPVPGLLAVAALGLSIGTARAQGLDVVIDLDSQLAAQAGIDDTSALEAELGSAFDEALVLEDQAAYMAQMANANVLSAKGMGVDYASGFKRVIIGGGFGSAVNSAGFTFSKGDAPLPSGGFAFQATVMGGLNLGGFSDDDSFADRIRLYGNGMYAPVAGSPFTGELLNYGGHLQIALIKPVGGKRSPIRFGGIDLTTGYERSRYTMRLEQGLPVPAGDATWDATGSYTITSEAQSVPVELSTSMKATVFTVYMGGAADLNLDGTATGEIALQGPLRADNPATGQSVELGTASVSSAASGLAAQVTPRMFGGVMLHLLAFKVYGHLNITADRSVGGHIGGRLAF